MPFKYTFIYQSVSGGSDSKGSRMAGWSESYCHIDQFTSASSTIIELVATRAALLTTNTSCVGLRVADLSNPGRSALFEMNVPGTNAGTPDMPSTSVLCQGYGSSGAVQRLILRGIPDEAVVRGEEAISANLKKRLDPFFAALAGFFQNVRNTTTASFKVVSIDENGNVITETATPYAVGTAVRILRTRSPQNGKPISVGRYLVETVTDPRHFKLLQWSKGATVKGRIRQDLSTTNTYIPGNLGVVKVITRKVGRPFFSYVGKRSTASRQIV